MPNVLVAQMSSILANSVKDLDIKVDQQYDPRLDCQWTGDSDRIK